MPITETSEKRFESDIEAYFLSPEGGYTKGTDTYDPKLGLYQETLLAFVRKTQPKEWTRFANQNQPDPERKFCLKFNDACDHFGLLYVLRHGFKTRGIEFRVCYFNPNNALSELSAQRYESNICECRRQWFYSADSHNSVDMMLSLNGIPVFAFELKNQYTGQTVDNAKRQWMYDRDPRETCFQFNKRVLGYFCVDHTHVLMATKLSGRDTYFLPFNQGSNGAGHDGGAGNPENPGGYPTAYLWEKVFQKDSMLDILQRFMHLQRTEEHKIADDGTDTVSFKENLIFPRYHQLDVVRKLISDCKQQGPGHNYLIQHSAGSGKSNSIAWTAYRLASLFNAEDKPMFSSVIIVTDRRVLDQQLQQTVSSFDHTLGVVEVIDEEKHSVDLRDAINTGKRIIVTTLQKFPVIYEEVDKVAGRCFAIIVDEAHSSQTGSSAMKLKAALADPADALREYAELEGKAESDIDLSDKLIAEMIRQGKHSNLSFFAFTATPKDKTLQMFGTRHEDGTYRPFHIYSMKQAIEEGFILDVLQNYMTYMTCYRIAKNTPDNPDVPEMTATRLIKKYQQLHPYNISQKTEIIVETFRSTTRDKIGGKGKMMVVTSSRLAAVRYLQAIRAYAADKGYTDIKPLVAFSGAVKDGDNEYTESGLNIRPDGSHISEDQTKAEFHANFNILVVAEKYQTGFDEPLLHTMIVDKKLMSIKAVQTLSRLNRTCAQKNDTFVLDFANEADAIQDAFEPFYKETFLLQEAEPDLLYQVQKDLRDFNCYTDLDIDAFCNEYYKPGKQDPNAMGRMTSILQPVAGRYNCMEPDQRYQFRRKVRSLTRMYSYITQVVRLFDAALQKESVFCSYLLKLLPPESTVMLDLEGKLQLEYYRLKKTFEGDITLNGTDGGFEPPAGTKDVVPEEDKPLEEIIAKINEQYKGEFTAGDRVVLEALRAKLIDDPKLIAMAKSSDEKIFAQSIFPKAFGDAAMASYLESAESFQSLFEDKAKYGAIMRALADALYREMRKSKPAEKAQQAKNADIVDLRQLPQSNAKAAEENGLDLGRDLTE